MSEDPQDRIINASHKVLLSEAERGNQAAVVEAMHRLKKRIETLDQNVSGLLSAIHSLDKRILLFTVAIFVFTVVQVALTVYFGKP